MEETIFVEGLYLNKVHEKAPAFIITNQSIHVEKLMAWLEANKLRVDDKGYIRVVGKESKEGKRYMVLDTWKPTTEPSTVSNEKSIDPNEPPMVDENGLPF